MDIVLSTKLIFGTFTASTLTTLIICKSYNIPFINPNQNRYQLYTNLVNVVPTTLGVIMQSIIIYSFLVNQFIENKPHTYLQNIEHIVKYSILAEFIYYIYHRIIHTKDYYKNVHSLHHENVEIYPFDTFYMTKTDSFFLILSLGAPTILLRMNYFESIVSLYIYITATYLEHSNFVLLHHAKHHKLFFYNFCILNPIFDILLGTYR